MSLDEEAADRFHGMSEQSGPGGNHSSPATEFLQELLPSPTGATLEVQTGGISFTDEAVSILTTNSILARSLLGRGQLKRKDSASLRRKREFIPDEKKDDGYWDKRKKNNEAAKRSREKRRVNDMVLENRVIALLEENARLKAELLALKFRFGLIKDPSETTILPIAASIQPPPTPAPSARFHTAMPAHSGYLPRTEGSYPGHSAPAGQAYMQGYGGRGANRETPSFSEDSGFSTPGSSSVGSPVFFDDRLSEHGKFSPQGAEEPGYEVHPCPVGGEAEAEAGQYPAEAVRVGRYDLGEGMKSLPHKLRFKTPSGPECGEVSADVRRSPAQPVGGRELTREPMRGSYLLGNSQSEHAGGCGVQPAWQHGPGEESKSGRAREEQQYCAQPGGYPSASPQDSVYHVENTALKSQLSSLTEEVAQLKKLFSQQLLSKMN
ncbi:NFIL3 like protein [Amia ocellicauda]|uniref:NFIL3 like protein n=1 Tax=Amia ocellicauda TaxID=2972642 RepID=UPI0034640E06